MPEDCAGAFSAAVTTAGTPTRGQIPHTICNNLPLIGSCVAPPFSSSFGRSRAGSCDVRSEGKIEPLSGSSSDVAFECRDSRPSSDLGEDIGEDMNDQSIAAARYMYAEEEV